MTDMTSVNTELKDQENVQREQITKSSESNIQQGGGGGARGGASTTARWLRSSLEAMEASLEALEASLAASRADEVLLLRRHARLTRHARALADALHQATRCNRLLVGTLWRQGSISRTAQFGDEDSVLDADLEVAAAAAREASAGLWQAAGEGPTAAADASEGQLQRLQRELEQLQEAAHAREVAMLDVCLRFLQMKRRREQQAAREAQLLRTVRGLQAVLACTTNMLRRATQLLRRERARSSPDADLGRTGLRHAATQTPLNELASRYHIQHNSGPSTAPAFPCVHTHRRFSAKMGGLPDVIVQHGVTPRQHIFQNMSGNGEGIIQSRSRED